VPLYEPVLATQHLELRCGHEPRVLQQQQLVGRRRDSHHRANLRIRDLTAPKRIVDRWKFAELASHADMFARRGQVPANAPGQPVRTRQRPLPIPTTSRIELAQICEQPMHGSIEVRRLLCDSFTQLFELTVHSDWISQASDSHWKCEVERWLLGARRVPTNTIKNRDGGTHLTGFRHALTRTINNYASEAKLLKDAKRG